MADFKAHGEKQGPKLGQMQAAGLTGIARRAGAEALLLTEDGVKRVPFPPEAQASPPADGLGGDVESGEAAGAGLRGTDEGASDREAGRPAPATGDDSMKKAGRPKTLIDEPWKAEGISRRTWERRRAKDDEKGK